jgi:hypothetical protein
MHKTSRQIIHAAVAIAFLTTWLNPQTSFAHQKAKRQRSGTETGNNVAYVKGGESYYQPIRNEGLTIYDNLTINA